MSYQVKEEDLRFSKLTPANIVKNYLLDMQGGDFGILDDIKAALHQEIALELIKAGEAELLSKNMQKFKDLDPDGIARAMIDSGENLLAKELPGKIEDLDFEEIGKEIDKI